MCNIVEVSSNERSAFVSVPMSVGGWCIWTPGVSGDDDDDQVSGCYWYHIERDHSSQLRIREGGQIYNCSRGGFLETWRESLRGDKQDTPCIVYLLRANLSVDATTCKLSHVFNGCHEDLFTWKVKDKMFSPNLSADNNMLTIRCFQHSKGSW